MVMIPCLTELNRCASQLGRKGHHEERRGKLLLFKDGERSLFCVAVGTTVAKMGCARYSVLP